MAFVVTKPCHDCKYTDCVVICPCECFYEDEHMLYIDPDDCIDCGACVPECPVEAIFPDYDTPSEWREYIELNAVRSAELKGEGRNITEKQEPKIDSQCASH